MLPIAGQLGPNRKPWLEVTEMSKENVLVVGDVEKCRMLLILGARNALTMACVLIKVGR